MSNLRQAAQQALEAFRMCVPMDGKHSEVDAAFRNLRAALAEPVQEPVACAWHGDEDGTYETSCKHIFQMIDGTPHENNFTHCCFCGKSLVQHQWEDGNDE